MATEQVWRICIEVPADKDIHDELLEAVADAAYEWEARFTEREWDINVYASVVEVEVPDV